MTPLYRPLDCSRSVAPGARPAHAVRADLAAAVLVLVAAFGWGPRVLAADLDVLTVHYHRFEQDYDQVGLWTWDEQLVRTPQANEIMPASRDDFGVLFRIDTSLYGKPGDRIGLLPRLRGDWQFKDGPDRFWQPSLGREVYIVQGRPEVYRERPDVRPQLASATLDDENLLTVRFTHRVRVADYLADRFSVASYAGHEIGVASVQPILRDGQDVAQPNSPASGPAPDLRTAEFAVTTSAPLDLAKARYLAGVRDMGTTTVRAGRILQRPDRFYDADAHMGAVYSPTATTFCLFAPIASRVWVVLADELEGGQGRREIEMQPVGKGLWRSSVTGDLAGKFYAYRLEDCDLESSREVTDPYATCTQNKAVRTLIVDPVKTDPPGFRRQTYTFNGTPADAIIYELHVRDFSIAPNSGIAQKGRYLGLTQSGTRLTDHPNVSTGLDHLCELGITHVQLLPIQDFENDETDPQTYNWGYMPVNFNSPDGWYAGSVTGPGRITEFKQAVQALHGRGIGVVMDVVYNHTAGPASFEQIVPGYYHRRGPDGGFSNGSGCGNEFASEAPMGRKFILDSLKYWVREYDVDGFRFDLMGLIDLETMKRIQAELSAIKPGILIYGEPWTGGPTPLDPITGHPQVRGTGLGAFNDHLRDAIKGDRDGGLPGFIQAGERVWGIRLGLEGAIHDWSADPRESVNYFEAHDNLTAWDKLLQSMPNASDAERRQAMRMGSLILLVSQGAAFLHAGQEFCRTKEGKANSYNQPDAINRVDWSAKLKNADVCAFVRGMIALRKAHPALRLAGRSEVEQRSYFHEAPNNRSLVWRIKGEGLPGETAREILVLLNGSAQPTGFVLPARGWKVYADADRAGLDPIREVDDAVQLPARSGMLLVR